MEMREVYAEVRCTTENTEGFWMVDAYKTDDDNEIGEVIAAIHSKSGDVFYVDNLARRSPLAQEVIQEKVAEINGRLCSPPATLEELAQIRCALLRKHDTE